MIYPLYYVKNKCIKCGSDNTLKYICVDGNTYTTPIRTICSIVCSKCKTEYFPKWIKDENGKMIPVCGSKDEIENFETDFIKYSDQFIRKI